MSVIDCSKCFHCEVCGNRYSNDGCAGECSYFLEHNPSGDAISREAVRAKIWKERVEKDEGCNSDYIRGLKTAISFIDNAQAIPLPNEQIAWEQGYEAGLAQGSTRPQVVVFTENADEKAVADLKTELQSVIGSRTQGEWIEYNATGKKQYMCSKCSMEEKNPKIARYCYWCGAKMKGGVE